MLGLIVTRNEISLRTYRPDACARAGVEDRCGIVEGCEMQPSAQ